MGKAIIEAENLTYSFNGTPVLGNLSFSLEEFSFSSFIGPSGCGKTTLLHILAGIYRDYDGKLSVRTDHISFVFQKDSLLEWRDALSNILLPFELERQPIGEEQRQKARELLALVGLEGYERFFPRQLSGGMRKRVEIARALVSDPDLLILDEPFSALDIITRERLNILVKRIHSLRKTTVVLVTHSVEEACFLSDRIYVMSMPPASFIQVRDIPEKNRTSYDRFLLTDEEITVNNSIRERAKSLWTDDGAFPAEVPRKQTVAVKPAQLQKRDHMDSPAAALPAEPAPSAAASRPAAGPAAPERFPRSFRRWAQEHYNVLLIPLELIGLYFLLSFVKHAFNVPDLIFPAPAAILSRFAGTITDGSVYPDLGMTVIESLSGFTIAFVLTMLLGYIIAKSRLLSNLLMPYLIAANTIPSVALAPFLVLWFGFGLVPKIITSIIVIFFPMLINNTSAIHLAETGMRDLIRFYRPKWFMSFVKFEFPAALPVIFSGIKVSITLSVIGAVVGEFVSGSEGLGSLVSRAKAVFDVELMFVGLIWLIILGLAYYGLASLTYSLVLAKRKTQEEKKS